MEIQWSLTLFTALTGMAGWAILPLLVDDFKNRNDKIRLFATLVILIVEVVGGLLSITHLSHPDRVLGALSHPTSGIFVEAMLTGITSLFLIVYAVLVKREMPAKARRIVLVLAAVFGIALSFMAGASYMMNARLSWNTPLLPLGYCCTAIPTGFALYLVICLFKKVDLKECALSCKGLFIGGIVSALVVIIYAAASGSIASSPIVLWVLCVLIGGAAPAAIGYLLPKHQEKAFYLSIAGLCTAFIGSLAFRCFMWLTTIVVANFFQML